MSGVFTCQGPQGVAGEKSFIRPPDTRKCPSILIPLIPVVAFQHFYVQGDSVWGSTRNACITSWYQHRGLVLFISFCDCRNEDAVPSPLPGPQEVVRLFEANWGAGRDAYNLTAKRVRRAGQNAGLVLGETMSNFFLGPSESCDFLWKTGNFRISPGLEKRTHVPSKSRFTATEVETVLDYRSLDFYIFWCFEVIFANLGIGKNKRRLTRK